MSIPIKIQCGCGQRYAFEVEPVNGQMASAVTCPVCGMDGTEAANQSIAYTLSMQAPQPAAAIATAAPVVSLAAVPAAPAATAAARPGGALRISAVSHAPAAPASAPASPPSAPQHAPATSHRPRPGRLPGQMDRAQAETEARAKVSWGDSPEQVLSFLMIQGLTREEALEIIDELFTERAKEVRKRGFFNIGLGILMLMAPVVGVILFLTVPFMPMIILAIAIMIGVGGFILLVRGIFMVVAPRQQKGDVAES